MCHLPHDSASPFAAEFRAFAEEDRRSTPPDRPILFYGSSSIRLWESLAGDFDGLPVVNRGFGGSTLAECNAEFDRLVTPLRPRAIVLYAGENDLDQGASPLDVLQRFHRFASMVRGRLGPVPLIVLTVKPSPARMGNAGGIQETNRLLREAVAATPPSRLVDVYPRMVDAGGRSNHAYFGEDWLHLSAEGYRLWTGLVREALQHFRLAP